MRSVWSEGEVGGRWIADGAETAPRGPCCCGNQHRAARPSATGPVRSTQPSLSPASRRPLPPHHSHSHRLPITATATATATGAGMLHRATVRLWRTERQQPTPGGSPHRHHQHTSTSTSTAACIIKCQNGT